MTPDGALVAWSALTSVPGLGPKRLVGVAQALGRRGASAATLIGADRQELLGLGLSPLLAARASEVLRRQPSAVPAVSGVAIVHADHGSYPRERLGGALPLPVLLYCRGNLGLLSAGGVGIAGSRTPHEAARRFAAEVALLLSGQGINVVGGHAAGIDEVAHATAVGSGGTTVAVLAEGIERWKPRHALREADPRSLLLVSEFGPRQPWSVHYAMQRNVTVAALADALIVVAAGTRGGSWAQGQLCLRAGVPLMVPDFPPDIAEGNRALIRSGAVPLDPERPQQVLDCLQRGTLPPARQSRLFPSTRLA